MKTKEKPFKVILSREQQTFLKEQKQYLNQFMEGIEQSDDDIDDDTKKEYYITKAIFTLPVVDQNLFLIKTFGEYSSVTELANDLHITKQTLCNRMRKIKIAIKADISTKL